MLILAGQRVPSVAVRTVDIGVPCPRCDACGEGSQCVRRWQLAVHAGQTCVSSHDRESERSSPQSTPCASSSLPRCSPKHSQQQQAGIDNHSNSCGDNKTNSNNWSRNRGSSTSNISNTAPNSSSDNTTAQAPSCLHVPMFSRISPSPLRHVPPRDKLRGKVHHIHNATGKVTTNVVREAPKEQ